MSAPQDLQSEASQAAPISPDEAQVEAVAAQADAAAQVNEVERLKAQNAELTEQFLRAKAEVENIRRRSEDEITKARKFAVEGFAESLLPVIDSLEAGLAIQEATVQQIREGSEATLKQLQSALNRNKVIAIAPAAGEKFDPHQHQAISVVPADQEANTVVTVLQKGYLIAERVLRPALITVAAPK
ncbi:nucleotide exchange factor GrpE [Malikia sp.]|uniref:nucleotide exchange factor GrpE n=1 Tax=Malikia sp. TaxID=2070706 RepID=UPI0026220BE6|nr:nucleotide exchange factor GrpE [Malikia sp.]MDD2729462.1 nucleotide exchange factor GrpE [Malikia sp.]